MRRILVTGGAGYIGSHACCELLQAGYEVVVVDNLSNSSEISLERVEELTGKSLRFHKADLLDRDTLDRIFKTGDIAAVIHFAGLKAVGESVAQPLRYFHNNLTGTLNLCGAMLEHEVRELVFSSSATVYGDAREMPITEEFPTSASNPYGRSKLIIEEMLRDLVQAHPDFAIGLLRYFNPVGAHPSGRIGEDPDGIPNNLMPYISQVAVGRREKLQIFGNDYPTLDGTGVRDYIHVMDLVRGHLHMLEYLQDHPGVHTCNLGTGQGNSVLEVVKSFEKVNRVAVPYEIVPRRPGDVAASWADVGRAAEMLGWKTEKTLEDMCRDAWNWQSLNPDGYGR